MPDKPTSNRTHFSSSRIWVFVVWFVGMAMLYGSGCSKTTVPLKPDRFTANTGDVNGYTPLIRASWQGDLTEIDYWLRKGAHIDEADHAGMTPIMHTALQCDMKAFRMLERQGADLTMKDVSGRSALHHAARGGCRDLLRYLHRMGNILDGTDAYGQTPLMLASKNHHAESVRVLLDMDAQPMFRDHRGQTALHHAIWRFGRRDDSEKISSKKGKSANTESQEAEQQPFFQRIKQGMARAGNQTLDWMKRTVQNIGKGLKKGAQASWAYITRPPWKPKPESDVTKTAQKSPPPVKIGSMEEGERIVRLLLEAGADPEIPDYDGNTPKELLVEKNRSELLP